MHADPSVTPPLLSYGLARGTALQARDDTFFLILKYPLKFAIIHRAWHRLFQQFTVRPMMALSDMELFLPDVPLKKITAFLNQLVYKGFLVRAGREGLTRLPTVSIIIPVRNRPREINECLTAVSRLNYPADKIETIVVDDASTDTTADEAAQFPIRLIRLKRHKQASFCRNVGARQAKGDILAFIDSDCMAHRDWLMELLPAFENDRLAAVGGRIDAYQPKKALDYYEGVKSSLMVGVYAKESEIDDPFFYVPACNFLIRRWIFQDLKGFDTRLNVGEDVDLCWRLQDRRYRLAFIPEGAVFHQHRNRITSFCLRRFQYGTSEPMLQKMHPKRIKRFLVPPAAVLAWASLALWLILGQAQFLGSAGIIFLGDSVLKKRRFKQIRLRMVTILISVLRSYAAFAYHLSAFISRYYLFLCIIFLPILPVFSLVIVAMHIITTVVEFRLKKPALDPMRFFGFFTLEQFSYQAGVWWGCIRNGVLKPVFPQLVTRSNST